MPFKTWEDKDSKQNDTGIMVGFFNTLLSLRIHKHSLMKRDHIWDFLENNPVEVWGKQEGKS